MARATKKKKASKKATRASGTRRTRRAPKKAVAKKKASKKKAGKKKAGKKKAGKKKPTKKKAAKKASKKRPAKKKPAKKAAKKKAAKKKAAKKKASKKRPAKNKPAKKAAKKKAPKKKAAKKKAAKKAPKKKATKLEAIRKAAKKRARPKLKPVGARKTGIVPPASRSSKRNFGLRGAAPWVARHAAKHAEELRKRNAEPPPPGSARATLRVPPEAEAIKSKIAELHQLTSRARKLRKKFDTSFFEIGELLTEVQAKDLYEAKGYASFESFLDREIDLPRGTSLRLIRICHTFQRETAYDFGYERLSQAISALDGEISTAPPSHASSRGFSSTALPIKPPIRFDD